MDDVKKQWQDKLTALYANHETLLHFMTTTVDNFAYRYLETADSPNLKSQWADDKTLMVAGLESSMVKALKITNLEAQNGIKDLARTVPKIERPTVCSRLICHIHELAADKGDIEIKVYVNWNWPTHNSVNGKEVTRTRHFKWHDLQDFRKGFPKALEEMCDLFL